MPVTAQPLRPPLRLFAYLVTMITAEMPRNVAPPAKQSACGREQVHDANVVATMLVHGIGTVVTMNTDDFTRFGRYVSLVRL